DPVLAVEQQLEQESAELADKQKLQEDLQSAVQALQERHREAADAWQRQNGELADLTARADALAALQAKIGHGEGVDAWLATRGLASARRLWQSVDIDAGWEDALEAVLRERLNALAVARLEEALAFVGDDRPPGRLAVYADAPSSGVRADSDGLLARVRARDPHVGA